MSVAFNQSDVLIIDHHLDTLRLLTRILENNGHQVRQALDPEMSLVAIESLKPDLILIADQLLQKDQGEFYDQLKHAQQIDHIPIILLKGFNQNLRNDYDLEKGIVDYLFKPYQGGEVVAKVNHYLKISYLQKELQEQRQNLQKKLNLQEVAHQFYSHPQINTYLLQKAIAATLNGIMITDATQSDHPIIYVNEGFEKMTGYSQDEVLEKSPDFLLETDKNQEGLRKIYDAIQIGQSCCVTLRNERKNGSLFWNEVSLSPVKDEQENIIYYIWIQADISERIKAQEEKQRYEVALKRMNRELQELNEKLYHLANLDGLTAIANRRSFDHALETEWKRMTREKQPLSLILGDIDHFKKYNDTYGHIEGDNCLKIVAQTLKESVNRPADLVARFGGEEFAILLPNTPLKGAIFIAESMLKALRERRLLHQASPVQPYVTMSLGVTSVIPNLSLNPILFKETADLALFEAKKQGRNQVKSRNLDPFS